MFGGPHKVSSIAGASGAGREVGEGISPEG